MAANATANLMRNLWSYMIIFCGHFPDGAMHFTEEEIEDETRAEWYLRQMLGAANFEGGPLLHIMSRQPRLPDRAPPLPRPAEQPLRRDLGAGAGAVRQVRHPLHDRPAAPAVRPGAAHDHQAVAARTRGPRATSPSRPRRRSTAGRKSDAERPSRIQELGEWSRGARARRRRHDADRGRPGPRHELGDPVRAVADLRRLRDVAGPARWSSSVRRTRWPATPSTCRRCTWPAPTSCSARPDADPALAAGHDGRLRVRPARRARTSTAAEVRAELAALTRSNAVPRGEYGCRAWTGAGTADDPWQLTTAPGSSSYTMTRTRRPTRRCSSARSAPPGSTYLLSAVADLTAWLREQGDWVPLGAADEKKPAAEGTVEAFGRAGGQPGRRLVRPAQGLPRPVRHVPPAAARGARPGRARAPPAQQPGARALTTAWRRTPSVGSRHGAVVVLRREGLSRAQGRGGRGAGRRADGAGLQPGPGDLRGDRPDARGDQADGRRVLRLGRGRADARAARAADGAGALDLRRAARA